MTAGRFPFGSPGLLRAVELLLEEDYDRKYVEMTEKLAELMSLFANSAVFDRTYLLPSGRQGQLYPRAVFSVRNQHGASRDFFLKRLLEGDPPVLAGPLEEDDRAFCVNPFGFQGDEDYEIVGKRIREIALQFHLPF